MRKQLITITACATILSATGCSQNERWVEHQKEFGEPSPTKFEAPFNQIREKGQPDTRPESQRIPTLVEGQPAVIEPDRWKPASEIILYAIRIKGEEGMVLSPYAPDKGWVDIRGFPPETDVRCPYTGRIMKVPRREIKEPDNQETLSQPKEENPEIQDITQPPTLEP
jgi:hypothetical protein